MTMPPPYVAVNGLGQAVRLGVRVQCQRVELGPAVRMSTDKGGWRVRVG
jgi:hypothetical protein